MSKEEEILGSLPKGLTLHQAMFLASREMEAVTKDCKNPAFGNKSMYANINSVLKEVMPPLTKYGIRLSQDPIDGENPKKLYLRTRFTHWETGDSEESVMAIPVVKDDAQGYGSTLTYARRYALLSHFGLTTEDDDGNAGSGTAVPRPSVPNAPLPNAPRPTGPPRPGPRPA